MTVRRGGSGWRKDAPRRFARWLHYQSLCGLLAALFAGGPAIAADGPEPAEEEPATLTEKWTVLWDGRRAPVQPTPLEGDSPLQSLAEFELKGVPTADRFQLRSVKTDGAWGSKNRRLTRMNGKDSALKLARGEGFQMQGIFNAEGLGGWFLLFGFDKGHGYGIYNVTLKESGSDWFFSEFRDSTAIEETHYKVSRFVWKGGLPLHMEVAEQKLTLKVGRTTVLKDIGMPNYQAGDVILGTYDTPYGPKPVEIFSLRMRAK